MSEHDPLSPRLAALAPSVDVAASRALFERRRSHPTPARRWLLPAAAVTLLIAGIVGVWALARPDHRSTVPVTPADESSEEQRTGEADTPTDKPIGDNFELLAVSQTTRSGGTVQIVTTDEDRNRALDELGADRADVDVDLTRSIMVVLNVVGNACPLILEGFDLADTVWTPQFLTPLQLCEDIALTWAYVVAIDRDALGSSVTIRLPPEFGGGEATAAFGNDEAGTAVPVDGAATGDEFVMLAVEETQLGFGTILVADDTEQFDQMWTESFAEAERPSVDFDHLVVVAFTLPDDACPDLLTRFVVEPRTGEGPTLWEPQFEPAPGACRLPLITRTYVVGIDRQALGFLVTFRLPGDDVYDFDTNTVTVKLVRTEPAHPPTAPPTLTPTGVRVPLPPVGEPQIAIGTFGVVWVVQHDDGTVSVLDAVIERPSKGDERGGGRIADLLFAGVNGGFFQAAEATWDAWGRAISRPRTDDLVGFSGRVVGGSVELFLSGASTIPGEAELDGEPAALPPDLRSLPLLDPGALETLSFGEPVWRYLDATLVVERGVGTLCSIDRTVPIGDLATCDDGYATTVRSTQPEITNWYFGPLLAEFDEFGRIIHIAPLGGEASRKAGPSATDADREIVTIQQAVFDCAQADHRSVEVRLLPAVPGEPVPLVVQVVADGSMRGELTVVLSDGSPATVRIDTDIEASRTTDDSIVVVRSSGDPDDVLDEAPVHGCG